MPTLVSAWQGIFLLVSPYMTDQKTFRAEHVGAQGVEINASTHSGRKEKTQKPQRTVLLGSVSSAPPCPRQWSCRILGRAHPEPGFMCKAVVERSWDPWVTHSHVQA